MKNRVLSACLVSVLLLVSCSGRVYTYRKTCKVKLQENTKAIPAKEKGENEENSVAPTEEVNNSIAATEEVITADANETTPVIVYKPAYKQEVRTVKTEKGEKKAVKQSVVKKLKKELSDRSSLADSSIYVKLLIAGLVFILAGIIVYALSGAGGALLTTIGVVLIILGLLLWLIDFL